MQKDNTEKMAHMKISKLMITMVIPMIFSMNLGVKGAAYATVTGQIVSFSHGMQNKKRINEGVKCGIIYTTIIISLLLMKKIKKNVINNVKEADYHE